MTVTITFDPDELIEMKQAIHATEAWDCLYDLDRVLRNHIECDQPWTLQEVRDFIRESLDAVTLDGVMK